MKSTIIMLMISVFCLSSTAARADDRDVAVALVKKAVAFYHANGAERLIEEVSNAKGQFVQGSVYVHVQANDGVILAHPMNSNLIGQNATAARDADGKSITQLTFDAGDGKTSPWIEYRFKNPKSNEVEAKVTYVEKVDEIYIMCGFYKRR